MKRRSFLKRLSALVLPMVVPAKLIVYGQPGRIITPGMLPLGPQLVPPPNPASIGVGKDYMSLAAWENDVSRYIRWLRNPRIPKVGNLPKDSFLIYSAEPIYADEKNPCRSFILG
jgi:hypothetical protein